jgi:hypothetical protein
LLDAALNHRLGDDVYYPFAHRAQEVGGVVYADGELSPLEDRRRCANTGDALDSGGVDAAVDDAPGRVVTRA